MILCLELENFSENHQRSDFDVMNVSMVLSGLSETEEAETFAWDLGNIEVPSHGRVVQVSVVVSTINFRPRGPKTWDANLHDPKTQISLSNSLGSRVTLGSRNKSNCHPCYGNSKTSLSQDLSRSSGDTNRRCQKTLLAMTFLISLS